MVEGSANTGPKVVQHYPWRLTDGLYVLGHEDDTLPVYLFDTGSGLLLIDAAFADWGPSFEKQIRRTGRDPHQVRWVVVTHYHGDHSGGAAYWKKAGAEIWAPAGDADQLRTAKTPVDRTFSDGALLMFGNVRLRAIATPGHTPGSTCFYCEWNGRKILFGEDIALHAGRQAWMGGPDSNWNALLRSRSSAPTKSTARWSNTKRCCPAMARWISITRQSRFATLVTSSAKSCLAAWPEKISAAWTSTNGNGNTEE